MLSILLVCNKSETSGGCVRNKTMASGIRRYRIKSDGSVRNQTKPSENGGSVGDQTDANDIGQLRLKSNNDVRKWKEEPETGRN